MLARESGKLLRILWKNTQYLMNTLYSQRGGIKEFCFKNLLGRLLSPSVPPYVRVHMYVQFDNKLAAIVLVLVNKDNILYNTL